MMAQLGFTFYPKDWWSSDSFFILEPVERYVYLELLFIMYSNNGVVSNNRELLERRLRTKITENTWLKVCSLLTIDGDNLTSEKVKKRIKKSLSSKENGKKGGRPPKDEEPKKPNEKPNSENQVNLKIEHEKNQVNLTKNPPSEIEIESEIERERESEIEKEVGLPAHPLEGSNLFRKPIIPTKQEVWEHFQRNGATKEMAKSFFEKHDGVGWHLNGSPIVNWSALANRFISNWNKKEPDIQAAPPLRRVQ